MKDLFIYAFLGVFIGSGFAQKVAPGVPPQHYQPNQQYQQVPQHHQQVPQHHQQVPQHHPQANQPQYQQPHGHQPPPPQHHQQQQQHHQQQPHHQQQQQPGGHHDGGHHGGHHGGVLHTGNLQGERDHIAEHMEVPNIDTSKMSEQELQFHYFKMHDSDNNNKLDGCELIKSLIHWHEQGSKEQDASGQQRVDEKVFSDDELVSLIDPILQMDDISRDGYIDYPEFIKAQQKAAANQQQQQNDQEQDHQED